MAAKNPRTPTSLRIPEDLKKWLQHRAVDHNRTLPNEILAICQELREKGVVSAKPT